MKKNVLRELVGTFVVVGLAFGISGCSDERIRKPGPPPVAATETADSETEYALRVLVSEKGKPARLVKIAPAEWGLWTPGVPEPVVEPTELELEQGTSDSSFEPPRSAQAIVKRGNNETDTIEEDRDRGFAPGWTLLGWAARTCLDQEIKASADLHVDVAPWMDFTMVSQPTPFHILHRFNDESFTTTTGLICDEALYLQEVLLCAADRLAQIGDSPGTTTWQARGPSGEDLSDEEIQITIPPQSTDDLFIARDMALNTLAHLVRLDTRARAFYTTEDLSFESTCTAQYGRLARTGQFDPGSHQDFYLMFAENTEFVDGEHIDFAGPLPDLEVRKAAGRRRLERKATVLASAARLVHDIVERSVRDDISGAQKHRSAAADALRGARAAWGVDEGQSPYNTLRHALRVLFGRLEIGNHRDPTSTNVNGDGDFDGEAFVWAPHSGPTSNAPTRDDPRCLSLGTHRFLDAGPRALDLVGTLPNGRSARWSDIPPKTPGESLALSMIDRAGIVVPPQALDLLAAGEGSLRKAIEYQLLVDAAEREGAFDPAAPTSPDAFIASDKGLAISKTIANLSESEIRFGLDRVFDAFRLLAERESILGSTATDIRSNLTAAAAAAGLALRPIHLQSSALYTIGGVLLANGVPRRDLGVDVMAKMRSTQHFSQCGMFAPEGGDDWAEIPEYHLSEYSGDVPLFQNAFLLGDTLRRQLGLVAQEADQPELDSVERFAKLAGAEVRMWAGPGTILRGRDIPNNKIKIHLVNIAPSDLGVQDISELEERLVLVSVLPTAAECTAGLRQSCPVFPPPTLDPNGNVVSSMVVTAESSLEEETLRAGLDHPVITLTFPNVALTSIVSAVIRPRDGSPGRVLATLSAPNIDDFQVEVISNRQRELANQVFGVAESDSSTRTCTNIAPLALPRDYCIEGMKRDQFVPLANELTSAGTSTEDSWRHYLDLAERASAKADELGNAMIDIGREFDVRKEAAAEEVGDLCGVFGTVDNTTVEGGELELTQDDDQLNQCIGGKKYDIVFLRDDPFVPEQADPGRPRSLAEISAEAQATHALIRQAFCDNEEVTSKPPFCARTGATCSPFAGDCIKHAGLGFHSSTVEPPSGNIGEVCGLPRDAFTPRESLAASPDVFESVDFNNAVSKSWASASGLGAALSSLKFEIFENGAWLLRLGSRPLMGSDSAVIPLVGPNAGYSPNDVWPYCKKTMPVECSPMAQLMGEVFPDPPPGESVYPAVRAELERTLFYMGALAGFDPPGAIEMPLPAVNRAFVSTSVAAPALYGASRFADNGMGQYVLTGDGYLGPFGWGSGETTAMRSSPPFNQDYAESRQAGSSRWRNALWTQVVDALDPSVVDPLDPNNNPASVLAVKTQNATILFDEELVPGVMDRTLLRDWLSGFGQAYSSPEDIVAKLQGVSFYTPGVSCGPAGKYLHARHVCADAFVSPVFTTTYDAWAAEGCTQDQHFVPGPAFNQNLAATVAVVDGTPGWLSMYNVGGQPSNQGACTAPCAFPFRDYWRWDDSGTACAPNGPHWNIQASCAQWNWNALPWDPELPPVNLVSHERLLPSQCPPSERLEMFLETDLADRAHAMETVIRALTLSCVGHNAAGVAPPPVPPAISSVEDIRQLEAWLNLVGFGIDKLASFYFIVDLPEEVVDIARNQTSNVGAVTAGERGKLLLELEQQLRLIENGFASAGTALQQIGSEIQKTRLEIEGADIENQLRQLSIAAAKIENDRQRSIAQVQSAAALATGVALAAGGFIDVLKGDGLTVALNAIDATASYEMAGFTLDAAEELDDNYAQQADATNDATENQQAQSVVRLSEAVAGLFQTLRDGLTGIKNNISATLQTVGSLHQNERSARIALAKAAGADFVEINGENVPMHVNTVLSRQFDILKVRYERAISSAKRSAYLARLAVEQRLGVRLDDLHQSVGPLEPPASWVDDLCTVQGVDYDKLREALPPEENNEEAEVDVVAGFADQFVGDYVAKLREFIEFYNIQFPFRESDDVAIVSLREDLASSLTSCMAPSKNLLYYSDQLDSFSPDWKGLEVIARNGWSKTGCDELSCLTLRDGVSVRNPTGTPNEFLPLMAPDLNGKVSWLTTTARTPLEYEVWSHASPPAVVFQTVSLRAGTRYVLSWWDMVRAISGEPIAQGAQVRPYRAAVFDSSWNLVAGDTLDPAKSLDGITWSERHSLEVIAAADGDYHVAFSAALAGQVGASLAIAGVQLEEATGNVGEATAYEQTTSTRVRSSGNCPADTPSQFRDRFLHRCDKQACWFELKDLLAIDTELLNQGRSSLVGQVAQGNFNYRHGGIAVNVVGTGVIDCKDGSASCYGSAYVEYDFNHAAFSIPLEDYESNVRCFDFGIGNVRSGKALAAERYITLPMSSADRDMISQSPFLKPEFTGRPLSGSYRLRVKDSPSLAWDRVEDVQVVMNYRYWSRVDHSTGAN